MDVTCGTAFFSALNWMKLEKYAVEATEMIKWALSESAVSYETIRKRFAKFRAKIFILKR